MHSFSTYSSYALARTAIHLVVLFESSRPVNSFLPTIPNFLPYMSAHFEKWDTSNTGMEMLDYNDRKIYNQKIHKFDGQPPKIFRDWPKVLVRKNSTTKGEIEQRDRSPGVIPKSSARPMQQKFRKIISQRYLSGCYADSRKTNPEGGQISTKKQFSMLFSRFALHRHDLRLRNYARDIERNIKKWEAKRYNWSVQKFEQSIESKAVVYSTYRIHVTLAKEGEKSAEDYFVKTKIYMDNAERLLKEAMSDFLCTTLVDDDCCTKSEQASIEDVL